MDFMITPRKLFGGLGNTMFQMAYIYAQMKRGEIPDIYLQDEKYFEDYKEEIKKWYGDDIVKSEYVSLHIRRGDYKDNSFYTDLTQTDYYDKAIAEFPNDKFLVFCADRQGSDDTLDQEWVMNWLEAKYSKRCILFKGFTEIDDMNAMMGCKSQICANSSFSFWAAYLNPNPNKKVVAPSVENWYNDGIERTKCPSEWIRI